MGKTVTLDGLAGAIEDVLKEYDDTVKNLTPAAVRRVANKCRQEIRGNASSYGWSEYPGTWSTKVTSRGAESFAVTVYSKGKGASLAHLLEKGHVIRSKNGKVCGRAGAFSHIKQPEINAIRNIEKEIRKIL